MNHKTHPIQESGLGRRFYRPRWTFCTSLGLFATLLGSTGCTKHTQDIPKPKVETVTAYNVTLDQDATPEQVAYVLLRALADDVTAAQAHEHKKQKEALNLTFSLAAYAQIEKQVIQTENLTRAKKIDSLGDLRNEKLYKFVKYWAPIVAHYIKSFDTNPVTAAKKMKVHLTSDGTIANVLYPVSHDPTETDPAKQQTAVLNIKMVKEKAGAISYWRVARLGYQPRQRVTTIPLKTQPADTKTK